MWFYKNGGNARSANSKSAERREWTAKVSKIPFDLALHIGKVFHPGVAAWHPATTANQRRRQQ
jgi:hypothetical protein